MNPLAEILARLLIENYLYLETCETDDPDDVVRQLEEQVYQLRRLSPEDRGALVAFISRMAEEQSDPRRRELTVSMPEALGLLDEQEESGGALRQAS